MRINFNRIIKRWLIAVAMMSFLFSQAPASAQKLSYGAAESFVEVHGFVDLKYQDFEADGERKGVSTFDNHHFELFFKSEIRENLSVIGEVEYEHGGEKLELDRAEFILKLSETATVGAGRFYTPFGIERFAWYPTTNKFISRPLPMRQIVPGNWYANGVKLTGAIPLGTMGLNYALSLSNGLKGPKRGDRQFRDNNDNKTVTGRVGFKPIQGLEFGSSYSTGKYDDKSQYTLNFLGGDVNFQWQALNVRGEYVRGFVDGKDGGFNRDGFYLQAALKILQDKKIVHYLEPVIRFDTINPNDKIADNSDQSRITLGLNYSPYPYYLLKAEYQLIREDNGKNLSNDGFQFMVVADF